MQFDMFGDMAGERPAGQAGRPRGAGMPDEAAMVRHLVETGRYRILKKLEPRPVAAARAAFPLRGVIVDTETTGLNHRKDAIIEIGIVAFSFDAEGRFGEVTGVYGGLQQPPGPIPEIITRLTGITDAMVAGQRIDSQAVAALVGPADLVIAHNAGFDRPFCEAFSPLFADKAWACSHAEIDWSGRGFEGTKLGYLIGQSGYFHEGHRAVDDCFALLEVLDPPGVEERPFRELYRASQRVRVRLFAENSPFEMKDHLKARGYRWSDGSDGRPKCWWIELAEEALEAERAFLRTDIYRYDADPPLRRLTAFDRYRA